MSFVYFECLIALQSNGQYMGRYAIQTHPRVTALLQKEHTRESVDLNNDEEQITIGRLFDAAPTIAA